MGIAIIACYAAPTATPGRVPCFPMSGGFSTIAGGGLGEITPKMTPVARSFSAGVPAENFFALRTGSR